MPVGDTADMSDTLTIRIAAEEKARWEKAAADARESVAEYVREAVRHRTKAAI
jgi:predicted HicB family RNase H-like nuclease